MGSGRLFDTFNHLEDTFEGMFEREELDIVTQKTKQNKFFVFLSGKIKVEREGNNYSSPLGLAVNSLNHHGILNKNKGAGKDINC